MQFELLKDYYTSPRITGEILDCSMPMTFDQYGNCGYNCQYCFSTFQRALGIGKENYLAKKVKKVSVNKIKNMFTDPDKHGGDFKDIIKQKITMQWGGLSDPFCPIEKQLGVGYELLKFFKEIKYPICFSTKGTFMLEPKYKKYLDLFEGMEKHWSFKETIISLDEKACAEIEAGVPSPLKRLEVLKRLSDMGIWTILRLRPFIIGLSDKTYEELINKAADIGCKAMSTEFFCLELRSINIAREKYDLMSKVIGFDIVQFYKNISTSSGYLRLNYEIKRPYIDKMEAICRARGLNFHVSDAHHKERGVSGSCCGLPNKGLNEPALTNYHRCQFTNALQIAKAKGEVHWSDISKYGQWMRNYQYSINGVTAFSNAKRESFKNMSMYDVMRNIWNSPKQAKSPYKYFGGVLMPIGLDENKDVVYKYNKEKVGINPCLGNCETCGLRSVLDKE